MPRSRKRRVLDLFAGLKGWSQPWIDNGHDVVTVEIDPDFEPDIEVDILKLKKSQVPGPWDVILASPPCQAFSMAAHGTHLRAFVPCRCGGELSREAKEQWACDSCDNPRSYPKKNPNYKMRFEPKTKWGQTSIELVRKTLTIVRVLEPTWWWMENPMAGMRMLPFLADIPRTTVTYCQYGERSMKPTDLWGKWPDTWTPRPACKPGMPCHDAAPRGTKTAGTQSKENAAQRALIPYELAEEVMNAVLKAKR